MCGFSGGFDAQWPPLARVTPELEEIIARGGSKRVLDEHEMSSSSSHAMGGEDPAGKRFRGGGVDEFGDSLSNLVGMDEDEEDEEQEGGNSGIGLHSHSGIDMAIHNSRGRASLCQTAPRGSRQQKLSDYFKMAGAQRQMLTEDEDGAQLGSAAAAGTGPCGYCRDSSTLLTRRCEFCEKRFCASGRCAAECDDCGGTFCRACSRTSYALEFEQNFCIDCC